MADPVRIYFLGGLGDIGRNCMVIEQDNRLLIIDCGLMFPDSDMHGIDLVLPDFTFLRENKERIVGCVATHGHEDHVGGLQFLLRDCEFPVYGSPVTLGLAAGRIEEAGLLDRTGPVDLAALPPDAHIEVTTVEAAGHHGEVIAPRRYGGVRLYALLEHAGIRLDPDQHEDFLGKVVIATSADGRVAVIAGGEIEPRFQNGDVILAITQDGAPIEDGPHLIVPFDRRPGRWAKRITRIELRQA